jgi:hypothetical protein
MQCVANDLGDEVRIKDSPVLGEVARCYRRLADALIAGRGANSDQVNALEDICHTLRHETPVPRLPVARDALVLASNALMPEFSRKTLSVPVMDPMMGIRLHDLPECSVALAVPPGPPATAGTGGNGRVPKSGNGVSTSAIPPVRIVSLAPTPGIELTPPIPVQTGVGVMTDGQATSAEQRLPAAGAKPGLAGESPSDKAVDGLADRSAAKPKARSPVSELNASLPISESAVISALPALSSNGRKISRRAVARSERTPTGYGITGSDGRSRSVARTADAVPSAMESGPASRSAYPNSSNSGYSAATPPSLPLMGPPLRPQTSGSVR